MKILIVDDHAIVRTGLRRLLGMLPNIELEEAEDGRAALAMYRAARPDIVILDMNLPGIGGFELLRRFIVIDATARVLVFSMHAEAVYASRALENGALGYVSKNAPPEEVLTAVQEISKGARYIESEIARGLVLKTSSAPHSLAQLTERDLEIMRLLGEGQSLGEIAEALGVGYKTIANTSSQIKSKLGVGRTADLIRLSIEMGLTR